MCSYYRTAGEPIGKANQRVTSRHLKVNSSQCKVLGHSIAATTPCVFLSSYSDIIMTFLFLFKYEKPNSIVCCVTECLCSMQGEIRSAQREWVLQDPNQNTHWEAKTRRFGAEGRPTRRMF